MRNTHFAVWVISVAIYMVQSPTLTQASESVVTVNVQRSIVRDDGTVSIPAFDLPPSSFESAEATRFRVNLHRLEPAITMASKGDIATFRKFVDEKLYLPLVVAQNARYAVKSWPRIIGGIYTEVFTPKAGEAAQNKNRVLINLHGGSFMIGARTVGRIESIPMAATAGIKVISIDYRMAPEHKFPAASEDVAVVYREVLKEYEPGNIGIYGCSAGGLLTAQSIAWFRKENLPMPGAIGVFCASTHFFAEGDSGQLAYRTVGNAGDPPPRVAPKLAGPYFEGVSPDNPLALPSQSPALLAEFPPILFVTGSRAVEMSGAMKSQVELTLLGVDAHLSVWDGQSHAFFYDPSLPESREAYQIIAGFFAEHLGKRGGASGFLTGATEIQKAPKAAQDRE